MTGEGGIVVTDNEELAVKARLIRNHGEAIVNENFTDEQLVNIVGYNFRLTELQAAIGIEQLKKTDKLNKIRSDNYKYLVAKLQDICGEYLTPQKITHPNPITLIQLALDGMKRNLVSRGEFWQLL